MTSLRLRFIADLLVAAKVRDRLFDPDLFVGPEAKDRKPHADRPPPLMRGVSIATADGHGWVVHTLTPRGVDPRASNGEIVFLHGGAYAREILPLHWWFLARLAVRARRTITVPIYPLTPEHTHRDVFATLEQVYADVRARTPREKIALMGDSAGAGMSLALAQRLPVVERPGDLVLLSPWLDATLPDPLVDALQARDPLLDAEHLRWMGVRYAGADDPATGQVSPVNGPVTDLGRVLVLTGTRDILHFDCRRFADAAVAASGTDLDYREGVDLVHDWMLLPGVPEAHQAMDLIVGHLS